MVRPVVTDILLSIIVPVYNIHEYLPQCIESIIGQSHKKLQIILVDDGSTDGSGRICDDYARQDERIEVIHQKNSGLVAARKAGLKISCGTYIGFVDGDDYIEYNMFETLLLKIVENDVDFVHSGYFLDGQDSYAYEERLVLFDEAARIKFLKEEIFGGPRISYSIWSKIFRAELVKKTYMQIPNEYTYGEDMLCLCGCIMECNSVFLYPAAFYHYRIRQVSLSHIGLMDFCARESLLYIGIGNMLKYYGVYHVCKNEMETYYRVRLLQAILERMEGSIQIEKYRFDNMMHLKGKRIALYGAGMVGQAYYNQLSAYTECKIVAWADKKYQRLKDADGGLVAPDTLQKIDFDILLIAVGDENIAKGIIRELEEAGVENIKAKAIWEKPVRLL